MDRFALTAQQLISCVALASAQHNSAPGFLTQRQLDGAVERVLAGGIRGNHLWQAVNSINNSTSRQLVLQVPAIGTKQQRLPPGAGESAPASCPAPACR
jgi:hypothetical protein